MQSEGRDAEQLVLPSGCTVEILLRTLEWEQVEFELKAGSKISNHHLTGRPSSSLQAGRARSNQGTHAHAQASSLYVHLEVNADLATARPRFASPAVANKIFQALDRQGTDAIGRLLRSDFQETVDLRSAVFERWACKLLAACGCFQRRCLDTPGTSLFMHASLVL